MAIFTPLHAGAISGSMNGTTFSRNKGGPYMRGRVIPTNPSTALQQVVRNAFATLSAMWVDTLTQAQRDAWDVYAGNVQLVNALGQSRNVTGLNMYARSNQPRIQTGLPRQDTAPTIFDVGSFTDPSFAIDQPANEVDVTFDNTDDWANEDDSALLVYGSVPKSPSTVYFTGPYQFLGRVDGDAITAPTSPAAIALSSAYSVGQTGFFRTRVSRADGRLSASFRGLAVA
jgi:hypothetical protein